MTDHPRALNQTEMIGTPRERKGMYPFEAHNILLNVAAQLGLLGLLPFLWLTVEVVRASWPRRSAGKALFAVQIAAVSAWIAAMAYHGVFGAFEDSRQFWCFCGFAAALGALSTAPERVPEAAQVRPDAAPLDAEPKQETA